MESNIIIRLENKEEWKQVENLTREAFWNKYHPGCSEHYILHKFRKRSDFVKELDYVVEKDGEVIAHIMYCNSKIQCDNGEFVPVMTFGPVSVLPKYQGKGYGSKLIKFTMDKAKKTWLWCISNYWRSKVLSKIWICKWIFYEYLL